jgi:antitoxin CcdA
MGKVELKIEVDAELLAQAQHAGVNVHHVIDRALRLATQKADPAGAEARAAKWADEHAEAIADYNRRIRERGVFSDGVRNW